MPKTVRSIEDNKLKNQFILSILKKEITNSPSSTAVIQPLYAWVQKELPTLKFYIFKFQAIKSIIMKNIPDTPEAQQLIKPLYAWVINVLPTIKDDDHKIDVIKLIIAKPNPKLPGAKELIQILYSGVFECLKTMGDKKTVSESLLQKKESAQDMFTPEQWLQIELWAQE